MRSENLITINNIRWKRIFILDFLFPIFLLQKSKPWRLANGCELQVFRNMHRCTKVSANHIHLPKLPHTTHFRFALHCERKSLEKVEQIEKKMVKLIQEIIRQSKHQQFKLKVTLTYI